MAKTITTIDDMQGYLQGVVGRADHHAREVNSIVLPLLGAVVLYKDEGTEIQVRTYDGSPANMLWCWIGDNRYAFLYNHKTGRVEMRDRTGRGKAVAEFHNKMSLLEVHDTLRAFARVPV
jgi:hypothetical protein